MNRLVAAFAVAAFTLTAVVAQAQSADQGVSISVSNAQLTSATGYVDLKQQIAAKADAYCRAHPVDGTIATCKQDVIQQLQAQAEARRQAMIAAPTTYAQAQR